MLRCMSTLQLFLLSYIGALLHVCCAILLTQDLRSLAANAAEFEYNAMDEDKTGWMLLDPTENEQNAQRILTVWWNVPEARRPPLVLAVLCKKAAQLAEAKHAADDNHLLWQTMAKVPSSMLRIILERAYFHPDYLESTPQTQHAEGVQAVASKWGNVL